MVRVFDSGEGCGFDPHTGHGSHLKLRQFNLIQFASVYSAANEYQHCWEGTCDGLASCPGESVQLHSNCLRKMKPEALAIISLHGFPKEYCLGMNLLFLGKVKWGRPKRRLMLS